MQNKDVKKSPYEIRLDLLYLAQTILDNQHRATAVSKALHSGDDIVPPATAPTSEDIIAEAEKLNRFISKT